MFDRNVRASDSVRNERGLPYNFKSAAQLCDKDCQRSILKLLSVHLSTESVVSFRQRL